MKKLIPFLAMILIASAGYGVQSESENKPPTLIQLNGTVLQRTKHAVRRGDEKVRPAYKALVEEANRMLNEGTFSVIHKNTIPPSGDKHDYMSLAPYWWPDTTKENGLPYIRRDGEVNPERSYCSDHDELVRMAKCVRTLGIAFYLTEDQQYAEHAAKLLKVWFLDENTRMNPNLRYAQFIPGRADGRSYGIVDTQCLASMLDGVLLLEGSTAWTKENEKDLKSWFQNFNDWLLNSEPGKQEGEEKNNHGTQYDLQVCVYDLYTGRAGDAENRLHTVTRARLDSQLEADGSQPAELARTKPWSYSTSNLQHMVDLALLGERIGVNLWEHITPKGASIQKAIEWFFPFLTGEKSFPKEEINKRRSTETYAAVLMKTADRFGVEAYSQQLKNLIAFTGDNFKLESSIYNLTNPILDGPVTSDEDLFDALNLDFEGLSAVKEAVSRGDYTLAKKEFVLYLKHRKKPKWFFDWHRFGDENKSGNISNIDTTYVNQIAQNILPSCGTKYDFGKNDVIDWSINPTPNKYVEWTWQLSRHGYWQTLGEAYWKTGNERYTKAFVHQMKSWVRFNTLHDFADQVKYSRWRTIETGIRTLSPWPNAFFRFLPSAYFDDESIILMVKSFYEHALHLRTYPTGNNWLCMEMDGLFHIGILFPEFKQSEEWCRFASEKMYEEEKNQFYEDGAQIELAPGYHGVSLSCMVDIYKLAKLCKYKLPGDYTMRLEKMYEYYQNILLPNGCIPALNDGHWNCHRNTLLEGYKLMPHRKDFLYVGTEGERGKKPKYTSTWMPWAGWYVMRSGWDTNALYSIFEVGPFGAGHQHEDKLTFSLAAYGRTLIGEGGKYDYDDSEWRSYVLSARAHNITRVDGMDQNRRARMHEESIRVSHTPLKNRWISNDKVDFGEGWYTEGYGATCDTTVTHYRALTFVKNRYWLLIDIFEPHDEMEHTYNTWFHFTSPNYAIDLSPSSVRSTQSGSSNIAIIPLQNNGCNMNVIVGQKEPEVQGWLSDLHKNGQGEKYEVHQAATAEFTRKARGKVVEPYLLYPLKESEDLPIRDINVIDNEHIEIVYKDGNVEKVSYSIEGNHLKTLQISTEKSIIKVLQ